LFIKETLGFLSLGLSNLLINVACNFIENVGAYPIIIKIC